MKTQIFNKNNPLERFQYSLLILFTGISITILFSSSVGLIHRKILTQNSVEKFPERKIKLISPERAYLNTESGQSIRLSEIKPNIFDKEVDEKELKQEILNSNLVPLSQYEFEMEYMGEKYIVPAKDLRRGIEERYNLLSYEDQRENYIREESWFVDLGTTDFVIINIAAIIPLITLVLGKKWWLFIKNGPAKNQ